MHTFGKPLVKVKLATLIKELLKTAHIQMCTDYLGEHGVQHFPNVFGHETLFVHGACGSAGVPQGARGEGVLNRPEVLLFSPADPKTGSREGSEGEVIPLKSRSAMTPGSPLEMVPLPGLQLPPRAAS